MTDDRSESARAANATEPRAIGEHLRGIARTTDMHVALESHHYIVLSQLYRWMDEEAFAAAHGVMLDYFLRFTKYGLIELLQRNGFEITHMASTGGVYSLLGQIFLNHLAERGIQRKYLFRWINRFVLWLDKKIPDAEDTINWMCIASKRS